MITPVWIIGFTGHRPKKAPGRTSAEMEHLAPMMLRELEALKKKAEERGGRAEFLCGVAAGADLIAARQAEALGMPVHVILPMPESHFKEDFSNAAFEADWREAKRFINLAKSGEGGATFRVVHGSHLRDDCYYDVGSHIVYASDAVLALWDGENAPPLQVLDSGHTISTARGGTADVVDLAMADRIPVLNGEKVKDGYVWLSTPVRRINSRTGEVDGEVAQFAHERDAGLAEIREVEHALSSKYDAASLPRSPQELIEFVDKGARDWAARLRKTLIWGVGLHFCASLIAAISASAQKGLLGKTWMPPGLALVELLLVSTAIGLMIWTHWQHTHARWLELRLATELTRGLVAAGPLLDPLFPIATDHLPGWRRFCLTVGLALHRERPRVPVLTDASAEEAARVERFLNARQHYLEARIQDQISHFQKYHPQEKYVWHRYAEWAGPVLSGLALFFVTIALAHKVEVWLGHIGDHDSGFFSALSYYFLPIALPLLAGAIASLQTVTDVKRRAQVYPQMVERLMSARDFIGAIRTPSALRRFVRRTEEILLDEIVGWYAAAKGISH